MKEIMEEYSNTFFNCITEWPKEIREDSKEKTHYRFNA
jgi:hypothetical protein